MARLLAQVSPYDYDKINHIRQRRWMPNVSVMTNIPTVALSSSLSSNRHKIPVVDYRGVQEAMGECQMDWPHKGDWLSPILLLLTDHSSPFNSYRIR
ncbi:hypothetical protein WN943_020429 [Citrus x changshan-huyou]